MKLNYAAVAGSSSAIGANRDTRRRRGCAGWSAFQSGVRLLARGRIGRCPDILCKPARSTPINRKLTFGSFVEQCSQGTAELPPRARTDIFGPRPTRVCIGNPFCIQTGFAASAQFSSAILVPYVSSHAHIVGIKPHTGQKGAFHSAVPGAMLLTTLRTWPRKTGGKSKLISCKDTRRHHQGKLS